MACARCERNCYTVLCFDCRQEEKMERDKYPDFRETMTEMCRSCGGDLTPSELRQANCPYCGERP